jgi:DNA replication protein DnaC
LDDQLVRCARGGQSAARRERYLVIRTRRAHFPFQRTLEDFDFTFQPSIDERQVRELAGLSLSSYERGI